MAYSTQADIQMAVGGAKRLLELADWDRDGVTDAAVIADVIAEADALIDSFAAKKFTVPFNPVPQMIRRCSADLAPLMCIRRRNLLSAEQQTRWDQWASTDDKNPGWLLLLSRGVVTPGTDPSPVQSSMVVDQVETALPTDRDTSRDKLSGYW